MSADGFLSFRRAKFKTRLPRGRLYTHGHMWLRRVGDPGASGGAEDATHASHPLHSGGHWEIGLTRFAMRMLGEPVEADFEAQANAAIRTGQVVGWLEGFKAVTDLYSPMDGVFAGVNPLLAEDIAKVKSSPYDLGWLFTVEGTPGDDCVDTDGYATFLEGTIDKMVGETSV